jgi:hypothetical protein
MTKLHELKEFLGVLCAFARDQFYLDSFRIKMLHCNRVFPITMLVMFRLHLSSLQQTSQNQVSPKVSSEIKILILQIMLIPDSAPAIWRLSSCLRWLIILNQFAHNAYLSKSSVIAKTKRKLWNDKHIRFTLRRLQDE